MTKEALQEKYMELQMLEQQMKQMQKQMQMIEGQMNELTVAHQALDDLKNTKPGTDILVPVSNGIFAKATLKEGDDLIVNVGANVTVNKDVESAKGLINKQIDEMKAFQEKMMLDFHKMGAKGTTLEQELQKMISEK